MTIQLNNEEILKYIVPPLLAWYGENARELPWRDGIEPYGVWVSEIMLQQTRVEAVKAYYSRFMAALPTVAHLAAATEDVLLKLWEGLGYYTRVRNLQRAARIICDEHGGDFPNTYHAVRSLPGIGDYTAGAICSICFGQPTPAVDGNVLRVVARLTETDHDINSVALKKAVSAALAAIYPPQCGSFTQSLMELGAMVCTPNGEPKCQICPLKGLCLAQAHGTWRQYPVKGAKAPRRHEEKTVFVLRCGEKLAICHRTQKGVLHGMWQLPDAEGWLSAEQAEDWLGDLGVGIKHLWPLEQCHHVFTHIEWHMQAYLAECTGEAEAFTWVTLDRLKQEIALPTAYKKMLSAKRQG